MSLDSILRSTGKNILNVDAMTLGYILWGGGVGDIVQNRKDSSGATIFNIPIPQGTNYFTFQIDTTTNYWIYRITEMNDNDLCTYNWSFYSNPTQFTYSQLTCDVHSGTTYINICVQNKNGDATYEGLKAAHVQFELGSTATTYEPYHQGPESIKIPSDSKNIITYPYKETTHDIGSTHFTVGAGGSIKVEGATESTITFTISQSITLTPNTQYVLSGYREGSSVSYMVLRDTEARSQVIKLTKVNQTQAFTASHSTYELYIQLDANTTTEDYDLYYPQLEEGIQATDYSLNTGDKEVLKVSYGSRNLWQNTNTTFPSTLSYDSNTQTYTIGTGTAGYNFVAHKLDNPIPAGTVVTISAYFQSGKGRSCVVGGYHRTGGTSWQGEIEIPTNVDMTGKTLTATFTTTATVEEFMVFHNTGDNVEEPIIFQVQYELGNKATKYVPYSKEVVWESN